MPDPDKCTCAYSGQCVYEPASNECPGPYPQTWNTSGLTMPANPGCPIDYDPAEDADSEMGGVFQQAKE